MLKHSSHIKTGSKVQLTRAASVTIAVVVVVGPRFRQLQADDIFSAANAASAGRSTMRLSWTPTPALSRTANPALYSASTSCLRATGHNADVTFTVAVEVEVLFSVDIGIRNLRMI